MNITTEAFNKYADTLDDTRKYEGGYTTDLGHWKNEIEKFLEWYSSPTSASDLWEEYKTKLAELQFLCKHSKTEWKDETVDDPSEYSHYKVLSCNICNKELKKMYLHEWEAQQELFK